MADPEAMTYASLYNDIQTYCDRTDGVFLAQIDRLIMLSENKISIEAKGLGFQRVVKAKFEVNNPVITKPERWRQTRSFNYVNSAGVSVPLFLRKYEYCRMFGAVSAAPTYYADYDFKHFFVAAPPDSAYDFELLYYERPEPLSSSNQENWTTAYAPELLLAACMTAAQPFIKNPTQYSIWKDLYTTALAGVQGEEAGKDNDASGAKK